MGLRSHQQSFLDLCRAIAAGKQQIRQALVSVTPGGGKSLLPVIAAQTLIPAKFDALCWVVPREALQEQGETVFMAEWPRLFIPHNHTIRASTNDINPCRSTSGYITTYQAINADPLLHRHEFQRKRYILILDEPHHIEEGGAWHQAIAPIVEQAGLVVYMSGTFQRGDGKPIAFVPYVDTVGGALVDFSASQHTHSIRYSLNDALREQATLPIIFDFSDASGDFLNRYANRVTFDSMKYIRDDASAALFTVLETEYAVHLLTRCLDHWSGYRIENPRSKMLVVAHSITRAKSYLKRLRKAGIGRAGIATSEDSADAKDAIRRFKSHGTSDALDALVTVAMAYEGLDVPAITHIACLTHIRSKPWIEQMIHRATRVDPEAGPYRDQWAYIYGPDDTLLHECLQHIKEQQAPFVRDRLERAASEQGEGDASGSVVPLNSNLTHSRANDFHSGRMIEHTYIYAAQQAMDKWGVKSVHPAIFIMAAKEFGIVLPPTEYDEPPISSPPVTPSQEEAKIRRQIARYVNRIAARYGAEPREINRHIWSTFGRKRDEMTLTELREVWAWLQDTYPLE